jgi:hypothetical protein
MTFEQSILVRAGAAELFALTQDYAHRLAWDPFLKSAELLHGATAAAVGVRAWCVARSGFGMETEYVSYRPPIVTAVRMTRGPWFLRAFAGSWRFEEAAGQTRAVFKYHIQARPRCLGQLLAWHFARDTRKRLAALKTAAEIAVPTCRRSGTKG